MKFLQRLRADVVKPLGAFKFLAGVGQCEVRLVKFRLEVLAVKDGDDLPLGDVIVFLDQNFFDTRGDFAADFDAVAGLNGARRRHGFNQVHAHDFRRLVGLDGLGDDFLIVEVVACRRADYQDSDN